MTIAVALYVPEAELSISRTTTEAELMEALDGGSGAQWMACRVAADRIGRLDLVLFCSEQAAEAYAVEDE